MKQRVLLTKESAAVLLGDEECVLSPKSPVILTYVILPCTTERQNGTKVSPKRASLHSRATISAKSVALECRLGVARGMWERYFIVTEMTVALECRLGVARGMWERYFIVTEMTVALECRLGVARGRILERSKEHKWMVLLLSKTKTHTTVALYGENAAVVIGQGSGGAIQGI